MRTVEYYDAHEYGVRYRKERQNGRDVVLEILDYVMDGQPITVEELESGGYFVVTEKEIQEDLDSDARWFAIGDP